MLSSKVFAVTVACAAVGLCGWASTAVGSAGPVGAVVDHSNEHYTLDGQPAMSLATAGTQDVCVASADANGNVACFSSEAGMAQAQAARVRAGLPPLGWSAFPAGADRQQIISNYEWEAAHPGPPTVAFSAQVHRRGSSHRRRVAHAADFVNCYYNDTHIWTDSYLTGTSGTQGFTGLNQWVNYSSKYDNKVSSFWVSQLFQSRWHDYAYGNGAYYGNGTYCRGVSDLSNANMTDGGTANDRFSSFGDW